VSKDKLTKTRVTSAGEPPTPIAGAPQSKKGVTVMTGNRVSKGPALSRKNDPPQTAQARMGLHIGARVTRGKK
jgi:hypothetical protein